METNHNKSYRRWLLAAGLLLGVLASPADAESVSEHIDGEAQIEAEIAAYLDAWPARCERLKQDLAKQAVAQIRFPKQAERPTANWWRLRWNSVRVPIPAARYRHVVVLQDGDHYAMVFTADEGFSVSLERHVLFSASIRNLFTVPDLGVLGDLPGSAGVRLTHRLYQGFPTQDQVLMQAYAHEPEDLDCRHQRWRKALPIGLALSLKQRPGNAGVRAAIPINGANRGWVTLRERDDSSLWDGNLLSNDGSSDLLVAAIDVPKDSSYADIGLAFSHADRDSAPGRPDWLSALERALDRNTRSDWVRVQQAMVAAGLSYESADSVETLVLQMDAQSAR